MSLNVGRICNQDTSTKALSCYKLLTTFDFISALVLTRHLLDLTLPVTELLQGSAIDVGDSSHLIEFLKSLVNSKSKNVDQSQNNCYKSVLESRLIRLKLMRLNPALQQSKDIVMIFLQNQFQIILRKLQQCHS